MPSPTSRVPAEKERKTDEQKETEARVSILHWAEARRLRDEAQSRLESLGDAPADYPDEAQNLIDDYQNARDEFEAAEKGLGKTGHVPKRHRERHEARVAEAQERADWHAQQAGRSSDDVLGAQQEHERNRIRLENQQAQLVMEARRGPMIAAPGIDPHPPGEGVALNRFGAPVAVTDPFAASKPQAGVDTHYQDTSRVATAAPGLTSRQPADEMTAGQAAEESALVRQEVEQRGRLLQEAEKATAVQTQGEHQQGGPSHGRVENKQGGYKTEKKGARPEPAPGEKDRPATEKDRP